MSDIGKVLMVVGGVILLAGAMLTFVAKVPLLGRLPGDILIKRENFSFYFPLGTCIILSVIFSLIFGFFNHR
jgi:hypothetical protein